MKLKPLVLIAAALCSCITLVNSTKAQGTTFTYQGRLDVDGSPANGIYDFQFKVFNVVTSGSSVSGAVQVPAVAVSNGLFTVSLTFPPVTFDGSARWLDIGVATNGAAITNLLTPRQPITATPYAMVAGKVTGAIPLAQLPASVVTNGASGVNITGTFSGDGAGVTNVDLALNSSGAIRTENGVFVLNSTPAVASSSTAITTADVNGDGKLDMISGSTGASTLSVLTNNGSGGFKLSASPSAPGGSFAVAAADVNGDGKPDLITSPGTTFLSVLTNNGSGGFGLSSSPSVGNAPYTVAAADVNGDGKVDLISASSTLNNLSVLTNNGSGGFTLSSSPSVGVNPRSVTAADVNGDGKMDLISANVNASTLSVLTNNGSSGFVLSSSPSVGSSPQAVVAVDVNGDGKPDLITANSLVNTLTVLTNNGSGGFALSSAPGGTGSSATVVVAADVNGDGHPDLISNSGVNALSVLLFAPTDFNGHFTGVGSFDSASIQNASINSASIGTASFGSSLSQKINLYSTTFGIGIQNSTFYSRVGAGGAFAWYSGGVHQNGLLDAGGGTTLMVLGGGGLTVNGTFVSASDRNLKQDFSEVNSRAVLEKVVQLPIQSWAYKNDPNTKHVGPMAQDFYAAFAVGPDDKHITTVDESGVALAAIQGLNEKVEARSQKLEAENADLKARLEKLEKLLENKLNGGAK